MILAFLVLFPSLSWRSQLLSELAIDTFSILCTVERSAGTPGIFGQFSEILDRRFFLEG